jgi:hypothetical protein
MGLIIRRRFGESVRIRSKDGARLLIHIEPGKSRSEVTLHIEEPQNSTERLEVMRYEKEEIPWEDYNE